MTLSFRRSSSLQKTLLVLNQGNATAMTTRGDLI